MICDFCGNEMTANVGCDAERCVSCGGQAISCGCKVVYITEAANALRAREAAIAALGDVKDFNSLDQYQNIATKSAIYPGQGTALGLAYVALKLNGEAGEFAEHIGKAMRDDGLIVGPLHTNSAFGGHIPGNYFTSMELTPKRRALIIKEIGDVLWYLSAACNELGITLKEAAATNLQKLYDRTERDTLRGSGDER